MTPRARRPGGRLHRLAWLALPSLLVVAIGLPVAAAAKPRPGGPLPLSVAGIGSPFSPNGDGLNDALLLDVASAAPATLTVRVRDFDGKTVRTLASGVAVPAGTRRWSWNGRDGKGRVVPDGPYRVVVSGTSDGHAVRADRIVAKAPSVPYGTAPGQIVVALNAGHGAPDSGAYYGGIREADMNLDIARRLQAMLEASGVTVVMVRTQDRAINDPELDVSGNGKTNHADELIARNDAANLARADVFVTLMNNAYGCHCVQGTETYTSDRRTWSPEGTALARFVQVAHLARLKAFRTARWKPTDRGVRFHDFFSVRPYQVKEMPRPALMPSILVESLFMDHPPELATLARKPVRTALAAAYFDGITRFLANREYGLRYELLDPTTSAPAGSRTDVRVRLTNRGNRTSAGWSLQARIVPAVPYYYARPQRGTLIGSVPLADGLAPGASVEATLRDLPLPPAGGDWIILVDVVPGGTRTLADRGVVSAQWRIHLIGPDPSPSPEPSPEPSPVEPSAAPSAPPASAAPSEPPASPLAAIALAQGRPGGKVVPTPRPGDGGGRAVRMRAWRRSLPFDALRDRPGPGAMVRWPVAAAFRRGTVPVDIPIESRAGMAGAYGEDHPH